MAVLQAPPQIVMAALQSPPRIVMAALQSPPRIVIAALQSPPRVVLALLHSLTLLPIAGIKTEPHAPTLPQSSEEQFPPRGECFENVREKQMSVGVAQYQPQ
uniref:Uncharacterized protein n=1 Tax=Cacopsylla melanoneura TaxID=428564 RepID=A0A8D8QHZ1_9HEMI